MHVELTDAFIRVPLETEGRPDVCVCGGGRQSFGIDKEATIGQDALTG